MRELLQTKVPLALSATLATQSFSMLTSFAVPVVAVQAAFTFGVPATLVGAFSAIVYIVAMGSGLASGELVGRYGAIRTAQLSLLCCGGGLLLFAGGGWLSLAALGAILVGIGIGPMNPLASHVLARATPPRWQPLVFSIKQTGTPMGGMLAGLLIPPLVALYDWRIAILVVGAIPIATALLVQPLRRGLDDDRDPTRRLRFGGVTGAVMVVLRDRPLRTLAGTALFYTTAQMGVVAFTVIFLEQQHGLSKTAAGGIFAIIHGSAIPARILWGWIAGRYILSWRLLGLLGFLMAASIAAFAQFSAAWPFALTAAVAILMGCSMNGMIGLLLAEFARLAPTGKVGEATGGAQFFLYGGIVIGPPLFGGVVEFSGSYPAAFLTLAVLCAFAGLFLLLTVNMARNAAVSSRPAGD